jgi:hypothetical protein
MLQVLILIVVDYILNYILESSGRTALEKQTNLIPGFLLLEIFM